MWQGATTPCPTPGTISHFSTALLAQPATSVQGTQGTHSRIPGQATAQPAPLWVQLKGAMGPGATCELPQGTCQPSMGEGSQLSAQPSESTPVLRGDPSPAFQPRGTAARRLLTGSERPPPFPLLSSPFAPRQSQAPAAPAWNPSGATGSSLAAEGWHSGSAPPAELSASSAQQSGSGLRVAAQGPPDEARATGRWGGEGRGKGQLTMCSSWTQPQ